MCKRQMNLRAILEAETKALLIVRGEEEGVVGASESESAQALTLG